MPPKELNIVAVQVASVVPVRVHDLVTVFGFPFAAIAVVVAMYDDGSPAMVNG